MQHVCWEVGWVWNCSHVVPFWLKTWAPHKFATRHSHCWVEWGCMSLVPSAVDLTDIEGTEVSVLGALIAITCSWILLLTWVCHTRCLTCGRRQQVREVKLPSGLIVSYGGPSARWIWKLHWHFKGLGLGWIFWWRLHQWSDTKWNFTTAVRHQAYWPSTCTGVDRACWCSGSHTALEGSIEGSGRFSLLRSSDHWRYGKGETCLSNLPSCHRFHRDHWRFEETVGSSKSYTGTHSCEPGGIKCCWRKESQTVSNTLTGWRHRSQSPHGEGDGSSILEVCNSLWWRRTSCKGEWAHSGAALSCTPSTGKWPSSILWLFDLGTVWPPLGKEDKTLRLHSWAWWTADQCWVDRPFELWHVVAKLASLQQCMRDAGHCGFGCPHKIQGLDWALPQSIWPSHLGLALPGGQSMQIGTCRED